MQSNPNWSEHHRTRAQIGNDAVTSCQAKPFVVLRTSQPHLAALWSSKEFKTRAFTWTHFFCKHNVKIMYMLVEELSAQSPAKSNFHAIHASLIAPSLTFILNTTQLSPIDTWNHQRERVCLLTVSGQALAAEAVSSLRYKVLINILHKSVQFETLHSTIGPCKKDLKWAKAVHWFLLYTTLLARTPLASLSSHFFSPYVHNSTRVAHASALADSVWWRFAPHPLFFFFSPLFFLHRCFLFPK